MDLLLLTVDPHPESVLPSLSLLAHNVRTAPTEVSSLLEAGTADVAIVDARTDLAAARGLCRLLGTTGTSVPVVAVVNEGGLVAVNVEWGLDEILLPSTGPAEIDARLRLLVGRRGGMANQENLGKISLGELVIDEGTYTARLRGRPLDLTYKEFELLVTMARQPNRVFTRDQLFAQVWGSNFLGPFSVDTLMAVLEREHRLWDQAGIRVASVSLIDPMSFCMPHKVEDALARIKERWPEVHDFRLHLHDARNMALPSMYAGLRSLGPDHTLHLDGTIGGMGGCPYCGNGRATGMAPTEDAVHMMEEMGISTGIDLDKLIDVVWMAEEVVGHPLYGHVSRAGPRPGALAQLYDANMPFEETLEQAKHFKKGPGVYAGALTPYTQPIASPYHERMERGLPAYDDPDGDFPWKQPWFPGGQG